MQRAVLQQATFTGFQTQATRVVPGHGAGLENQAVNDDSYQDDPYQKESSLLMLVASVLVNVIGGSLLLSGMFFLPHLMAAIFA